MDNNINEEELKKDYNRPDYFNGFMTFILFLLVVGIGCYIYFNIYKKPSTENKSETKTTETTTNEEVTGVKIDNATDANAEQEITDKKVIEELSKKTAFILASGYNTDALLLDGWNNKDDLLGINSLTEKNKILLAYNTSKKINLNSNFYDYNVFDIYKSINYGGEHLTEERIKADIEDHMIFEIDKESFLKANKVFKSEISLRNGLIYNECPDIIYTSDTDKLYGRMYCGGYSEAYSRSIYYKNKYTKNGNKAYVYVNVGSFNDEDNYIYDDVYDKNDTPNKIEHVEGELNNNNIDLNLKRTLNKTIYDKLSLYKLTFEKSSDGEYRFDNIEKVKKDS